jgi:peroxiredoxin
MKNKLKVGDLAPDFELFDYKAESIKLSKIYENKNVLLVFNIGFG